MNKLLIMLSHIIDFFYTKNPIILYYHGVKTKDDINNPTINIERFTQQMEILKKRGFKFVKLKDIYLWSIGEKKLPNKSITLTFDDGLENLYENVFPLLKKMKIFATIFIIKNFIGKKIYFTHKRKTPQLILDQDYSRLTDYEFRFLSQVQIKEMFDSEIIDFGSHTLSHPSLSHIIDVENLYKEIKKSKKELEEKLSIPLETFCYPYGNYNSTVKKITKESGYICAVTTKQGSVSKESDPFEFKRISDKNLFIHHPPLLKKIWNLYGKF